MSISGNRQQRLTEEGSVTLVVALTFVVIIGIAVAAVVIGRLGVERRELQSAADALALAGAYSLQQNGLPLSTTEALPFAAQNTRSPFTPQLTVIQRPTEHRALVQVDLTGSFDSRQTWFTRRFSIRTRSLAQINEMVFGERWPALTIVVDASESMSYPILGSSGLSAFTMLRQVITAYAGNTLPVRNGVVLFNDDVVAQAPPPVGSSNNLAAITSALAGARPGGRTNARAGLRRARLQLQGLPGGRNVIFISDGEPTLGGPCAPHEPCHFDAAEAESDRVRNVARAALFTVEIRRTNYTSQATRFLEEIAGEPGTGGGEPSMTYLVQSAVGLTQFMIGLTRSICAFGPLEPGPGAPADPFRLRPGNSNLDGPPQRVFAFLREQNGIEAPLPLVQNRDLQSSSQGFEYLQDATGAGYVILTLRSCNDLGQDPARRLVVRWDDAQLTSL